MGTLMTHRQISCLDKSISLRCPNGTNVVLKDARYVALPPATYANIKDFNTCDAIAAGAINNSLVIGAVGETFSNALLPNAGVCQWHDVLQVRGLLWYLRMWSSVHDRSISSLHSVS